MSLYSSQTTSTIATTQLANPSNSFTFSSLCLPTRNTRTKNPVILCCSSTPNNNTAPPVLKKKIRYRREYPGENKGITEEMRFVAMKLRNIKGKYTHKTNNNNNSDDDDQSSDSNNNSDLEEERSESSNEETWVPSIEGFLNYLVDSKLVFSTVEKIVDESTDVAYTYFRNTGLERSESISRDLQWFSQQNFAIPQPSDRGVSYAKYLEELAEQSAPLFLSHFYNIYFAHIAGGCVTVKQVSDKLLLEKQLDFCQWEGNVQELLKSVRENINMLSEHWSRDDKNKCLREATKSFRFLGQIVRLIIL